MNEDQYLPPSGHVSVGPGFGIEVQIPRVYFSYGFILVTVIGVLLGLILVIVLITIAFNYTPTVTIPKTDGVSDNRNVIINPDTPSQAANPGAALFAHSDPLHHTQDPLKLCPPGRYGDRCQWHKHDNHYKAIGHISDSSQLEVLGQARTPHRSFTIDSCSSYCDVHEECKGFYHEGKMCLLLAGVNLHEKPQEGHGANLFSKIETPLETSFVTRNWFGRDTSPGHRYWLNRDLDEVETGVVTKLNYIPVHSRLHGRVAYFSNKPFSNLDEWNNLPLGYRHTSSDDTLNIPVWWKKTWVLVQ